jgi:hypothetical protein
MGSARRNKTAEGWAASNWGEEKVPKKGHGIQERVSARHGTIKTPTRTVSVGAREVVKKPAEGRTTGGSILANREPFNFVPTPPGNSP